MQIDTSEPEALNITSGSGPLSQMTYAPFATFSGSTPSRIGRFWRVVRMHEGPFERLSIASHAAPVSFASAGRNTATFGIARMAASCSTGSWVGPSSPT